MVPKRSSLAFAPETRQQNKKDKWSDAGDYASLGHVYYSKNIN